MLYISCNNTIENSSLKIKLRIFKTGIYNRAQYLHVVTIQIIVGHIINYRTGIKLSGFCREMLNKTLDKYGTEKEMLSEISWCTGQIGLLLLGEIRPAPYIVELSF